MDKKIGNSIPKSYNSQNQEEGRIRSIFEKNQRLALSTNEAIQKSEARLGNELATRNIKKWESVIVKNESTENPIAEFDSKAHKAKSVFYEEIGAKERAKVREALLNPRNLRSGTIKIVLKDKELEIKGKSDPTNPKLYLVTAINVTYKNPEITQPKPRPEPTVSFQNGINEINEHMQEKETNGAKIYVSRKFVKDLKSLLDEEDNYTLNSRQINGIFEKYFKLAGLNKGTGSSHSSKNGITFARQHDTSKQLHLGQVRKELETILNMCVVKETSKKAETKNF